MNKQMNGWMYKIHFDICHYDYPEVNTDPEGPAMDPAPILTYSDEFLDIESYKFEHGVFVVNNQAYLMLGASWHTDDSRFDIYAWGVAINNQEEVFGPIVNTPTGAPEPQGN